MSVTPVSKTPTTASKWRLDVNTGSAETPTWVQVKGINSFVPNITNTTQDATDFDTEGWGASAVTQRAWEVQLTVFRNKYGAEGTYDVGQEALRTAFEDLETVDVRWYDRAVEGGEAYRGFALVDYTPSGGGATALDAANIRLLGQGAREAITNPNDTP